MSEKNQDDETTIDKETQRHGVDDGDDNSKKNKKKSSKSIGNSISSDGNGGAGSANDWLSWLTTTGWNIPRTHATVGLSNWMAVHKEYRTLLVNRRLPDTGWSDLEIQHLLLTLSMLDTNSNQVASKACATTSASSSSSPPRWCGVGEREGRVYSSLVWQRHYGLSHGMGRSGDITEPQPKAVGSSLLVQLTTVLVLDAMRRGSGLSSHCATHGLVLPLCTGMTMSLVLASLRRRRQEHKEKQTKQPNAKTTSATDSATTTEAPALVKDVVLWSRIDQKSCFKAIQTSGFTSVVIPTRLLATSTEKNDENVDDSVGTDLVALQEALSQYHGRVLAVITTTSCFAPRVPDAVDQVAKFIQQYNAEHYHQHNADGNDTFGIAHVINHAYGLQCRKTCQLLNRACTIGRVDAIVCSTDKNFLVPVGGAMVVSPLPAVIADIGQTYAGRASSAPIVDLLITLLSMGLSGYKDLLQQRQDVLVPKFVSQLQLVAQKHGERLLSCPANTISFAITLDHLLELDNDDSNNLKKSDDHDADKDDKAVAKSLSALGAMLFSRCVSGTRVVPRKVIQTMGGTQFHGFGSSHDNYPHAYLTAACAIGVQACELDEFIKRLDKILTEFKRQQQKKSTRQRHGHEQEEKHHQGQQGHE
ncbi:hypothetical protein ACA910_002659 [Epithemia clementina (nom. ined.)]